MNASLLDRLVNIDRRAIYAFVFLALSIPLIFHWSLPPAPMKTADAFFEKVEALKQEKGKIVVVAMDWGPGTQAENEPQTAVAIEHLMRRRIPFMLVSLYAYAAPFLDRLPRSVAEKLNKEHASSGQTWEYGKDWVNIGYLPNSIIAIQGLAKTDNIKAYLKTDVYGSPLEKIPALEGTTSLQDVQLLMEFTGLVGVFNYWVQYFQGNGYRPPFVHGCTSITIPEAYIYFASKQIVGLFEGVAGAAWYEVLLSKRYSERESGLALRNNTSLAYAHLVIIGFIVLGNLGEFVRLRRKQRGEV